MSEARFRDAVKRVDGSIAEAGSAAAYAMEDVLPALEAATSAAAARLRAVSGRASALLSELGDHVPETREQMSRRVQAQPLTAVLIAAGVGLLTGLIFSRRPSSGPADDGHV